MSQQLLLILFLGFFGFAIFRILYLKKKYSSLQEKIKRVQIEKENLEEVSKNSGNDIQSRKYSEQTKSQAMPANFVEKEDLMILVSTIDSLRKEKDEELEKRLILEADLEIAAREVENIKNRMVDFERIHLENAKAIKEMFDEVKDDIYDQVSESIDDKMRIHNESIKSLTESIVSYINSNKK